MTDENMTPFEIVRHALNAEYAQLLPNGFTIYKIDEYSPDRHPAPNLWVEAHENLKARYIAILISDRASVPALGETVNAAVKAAIAKIEQLKLSQETNRDQG